MFMHFIQVEIGADSQEYGSRKQSENTITVKDNAVAYAEQQKAQSHSLFIFIFSVYYKKIYCAHCTG